MRRPAARPVYLGPILGLLALLGFLAIASESAAQCPGVPVITGTEAYVSSAPSVSPDPDEIFDFIGTGCTTGMFGTNPPGSCQWFASPGLAILAATWPDSANNATGNGCTFNCQGGGTCRLRGGDGMPVELMDFAIEAQSARSSDTPDDEADEDS